MTVSRVLSPVRVKAHNFDIRRLNGHKDSARIFGTDDNGKIVPVCVDSDGKLEVLSNPTKPLVSFTAEAFNGVEVTDELSSLPAQDTANKLTYSYAVRNTGDAPIQVLVELSPNGTDFAVDSEQEVDPNTMGVLVPNRFLRFTRLSMRVTTTGETSTANVFFNAQMYTA